MDTLEDTKLFDLEMLDDAQCEVPHKSSRCTHVVVWSAPPAPCGCDPRRLACQGLYDHIFSGDPPGFRCVSCGSRETTEHARLGWYKV